MFLKIDGVTKVKPNSLLAMYIQELGVKSWCALFVASCGVLAVILGWLGIMTYGTLVMTGVYYHIEQPFLLMAPAVILTVLSYLVITGVTLHQGGRAIGNGLLKFWDWSQNSCTLIEYGEDRDGR